MKKRSLILVIVLILCLSAIFVACGAKNYEYSEGYQPDIAIKDDVLSDGQYSDSQERKIIYTANVTMSVENLDDAVSSLNALLVEGEWVEKSQASESSVQKVLRIKSDRLNDFMKKVAELGEMHGSDIISEDVSLSYYDTTLRKQTLENEYARLNELLQSAENMSDILTINKRLTEIESELQKLQNKLNTYDSLIEYSRVTVIFYKKGEAPKKATFGDKVGAAYGINGKIVEGLGIFLIAILPYLGVAAVLTVGIILLKKTLKKKKQAKLAQTNGENKENVVPLNKEGEENK